MGWNPPLCKPTFTIFSGLKTLYSPYISYYSLFRPGCQRIRGRRPVNMPAEPGLAEPPCLGANAFYGRCGPNAGRGRHGNRGGSVESYGFSGLFRLWRTSVYRLLPATAHSGYNTLEVYVAPKGLGKPRRGSTHVPAEPKCTLNPDEPLFLFSPCVVMIDVQQ